MYLVYAEGVWARYPCGIFSTFDKAKKAANKQAENDKDNYHKWVVCGFEIDKFDDKGKEIYETRKQT